MGENLELEDTIASENNSENDDWVSQLLDKPHLCFDHEKCQSSDFKKAKILDKRP